jgi:hypothetical protein
MKNTAKAFLDSWSNDRENINNINNINNNLTTLTTQTFHDQSLNEEVVPSNTASRSLLAPTSSKSRPLGHNGTLPANWRTAKFDLFCNGHSTKGLPLLKLKLGIINQDGQAVNLTASLNSELRYLYYRIPKEELLEPHWQAVKEVQKYLKKNFEDVRGSKFYIGKKDNTTKNLAVFVYKDQGIWHADVIRDGHEYIFAIDQSGTESFRQKNGIYTGYYTNNNQYIKTVTLKELGI